MSVRAKRAVKGEGRSESATVASDVLKSDHPVHKHFVKWLGDKEPTKRQARKFLQQFPAYCEVVHVED